MLIVAVAVYIWLMIHALTGDTGPIGWRNALQAFFSGGYSREFSRLLQVVIVSWPESVFWLLHWPIQVQPRDLSAARHPDVGPISRRPSFVVLEAIIWDAAIGYGLWEAHGQSVDARATYAPLALNAGASDHVTRLLGELIVQIGIKSLDIRTQER